MTYLFPVQSPYYLVTPIGPSAKETRMSPSRERKGCETLCRLKLLPREGPSGAIVCFPLEGRPDTNKYGTVWFLTTSPAVPDTRQIGLGGAWPEERVTGQDLFKFLPPSRCGPCWGHSGCAPLSTLLSSKERLRESFASGFRK